MSSDAYKYNYAEKVGWQLKDFIALFILLALSALMVWKFGFGAIIFCIFGSLILSRILGLLNFAKDIEVSPRYLICGSHIIFYENVREFKVDTRRGLMRLCYHDGRHLKELTLERERFPTNARKAHKIEANKQQKFDRVTQKISAYIRAQAPAVVEA